MKTQKSITSEYEAVYSTLGELSPQTKNIWMVFHGYGQLSKHFINKFDRLDPNENYIIAPQGLSLFYMEGFTGKVGASWLTKEEREAGIRNYLRYISSVWQAETAEIELASKNICCLGFSQGVATAFRWAHHSGLAFEKLIAWAGSLPPEVPEGGIKLTPDGQFWTVWGNQDQFLNPERLEAQKKAAESLGLRNNSLEFDGKHEILREVLAKIV